MSHVSRPRPDEVDQLLLNAKLRDELEPYLDESIVRVNVTEMTTPVENEFLASMLAWEKAPILPIREWWQPELKLPQPDQLSDGELHDILWNTIYKLYDKRIVLDFTDHLSDRQLYCLILRDILPEPEKKLDNLRSYLHWDCADMSGDPEVWLRYYASDDDRITWADEFPDGMPEREYPPYPRDLPRSAD